jgi:hypothetical protein
LVSDIEGRTKDEDIWEQGTEENISGPGEMNDRKLEKTTLREAS